MTEVGVSDREAWVLLSEMNTYKIRGLGQCHAFGFNLLTKWMFGE